VTILERNKPHALDRNERGTFTLENLVFVVAAFKEEKLSREDSQAIVDALLRLP
jgi:hypothetical protein